MPQTQSLRCEEDTELGRAQVWILSPFSPVCLDTADQPSAMGSDSSWGGRGQLHDGEDRETLSALPQEDASVQTRLGH